MKTPCVQIPPIRKEDSTRASSELEKAKIYNRHLEYVFTQNTIDSELDILQNQPLNKTIEKIKYFSPFEIVKEIDNNLNLKKAPGYDKISSKILKELPRKAIILTHICCSNQKNHQKMLYHTGGYHSFKVDLEKLLLKRLKPIIEDKNLITEHQFKFRNKHSTIGSSTSSY